MPFVYPMATRRGRSLCLPFLAFRSSQRVGRRESLPLQDFTRNLECLFNDKSSVDVRTAVSARAGGFLKTL